MPRTAPPHPRRRAAARSAPPPPAAQPTLFAPDFLLDRVLHRDGLILVIDKPAGLPVHAGPTGGENLEMYLDALRFGLPAAPALAHRLDRDTSGCLILGRHRKALAKLGRLFEAGRVQKTYWAVVHGAPPTPEGRIELPLQKINNVTGWRMIPAEPGTGLAAATRWRTVGASESLTWLELYPETGRTHQIRVHCQALGCPLLGDPIYGPTNPTDPLHLHARALSIPLKSVGEPIRVEAAPPPHMSSALCACTEAVV